MSGIIFQWQSSLLKRAGILFVAVMAGVVLSPQMTRADCTPIGLECSEWGDLSVEGIVFANRCLKKVALYSCDNPNPGDDCGAIEADTARCTFDTDYCAEEGISGCKKRVKRYECFNGALTYDGAVLVDRTPVNTTEAMYGCEALEDNAACNRTSSTCVGGSQTRTINGIEFTRSCWQWDREYTCTSDGVTNTCADLEANPDCRETRTDCVNEEDGNCTDYEVTFQCGGTTQVIPGECTTMTACVGGVCAEYDDEPTDDFLVAQVWLKFLDEASKDRDADTNTIFNGRFMYCRRHALGSRDCCNGDGWGLGLNLALCRESEQELNAANQAYRTVYTHTWCTTKIFGKCLAKRRGYCVFNSRFGRVAQEQIRGQLERTFINGGVVYCNGLTIETLEEVDMEALDFTEAFPNIEETLTNTENEEYINRIIERLQL